MSSVHFKKITEELQLGAIEKEHPFHCFSLATKGLRTSIGLRTVVLREVTADLTLTFYTDSRSTKIEEIGQNNEITGLFYHPGKKIQLKILGKAFLESDSQIIQKTWKNIPEYSKREYTALYAPGTSISDEESIQYDRVNHNFAMVHIMPNSIEFLELRREQHLRVLFTKAKNDWIVQNLVP